jgi:hypothetical protein
MIGGKTLLHLGTVSHRRTIILIESSERLDSLMTRAKEHNDLMMLKTLNKTDFLVSAVYHSGCILEDLYCIRRHLKLNLKKLSSQLMRLPLTT